MTHTIPDAEIDAALDAAWERFRGIEVEYYNGRASLAEYDAARVAISVARAKHAAARVALDSARTPREVTR